MLAAQPLTPRQERFVGAYTSNIALFNATKSCRLAGYSEKGCRDTGYENLRKPHIREAISQRFEAAFDSNELTIDKVLQDLEMIRRVAIRKGDLRAALRAIELQGKYLGMFSSRFKAVGETQTFDEAGDAELVQTLVGLLASTNLAPEILLQLKAARDHPNQAV